jgi:signal transduction histidine kinase/CheY-like chemotaxis protein
MPRERQADLGRERLKAEQVRMLYHSGPTGMVGALVATGVLAVVVLHLGVGSRVALGVWSAAILVTVVAHLLVARAYRRRPDKNADWRPWAYAFVACSLLEGVTWGASAITLSDPAAVAQQLFICIVVCAICTASLSAFGVYLPAFHALFLPAIIPFGVFSALRGDFTHEALALLILIYIVGMLEVARLHNGNMLEMLRLRFENADLAAALRVQKEAAEEASLAKTRFLAAASHDLRQPVHALSLFVGALRGHHLEPEPAALVDRIENSVSAMDGLFSALLDISRLDAGVVAPDLRRFPIMDLLLVLERDYTPEAESKGLTLRIRSCPAWVRSDPVLLERILRNLLSNAVRYTDRGGVLLGCRRRSGLRIEIWDTGRGIPAAQAQHVFEEFFQLDNPERDRTKGLGLGLAIVRRLAGLLGHPIAFASVPGRGSMFGIDVPIAEPARARFPAVAPGAARSGTILVVDDEMAIQEGMRSLLTGWGHGVICAGSGDESFACLAESGVRPDLIICDYRLRGQETGATVIGRLRATYGAEIPGVLITGDTAPNRLEEAAASGLLLLHKPVSNSRLRAAVAHFLRARP